MLRTSASLFALPVMKLRCVGAMIEEVGVDGCFDLDGTGYMK